MNYNPFDSLFSGFLSNAIGYCYVGKDGPTGWKAFLVTNSEIIKWIEDNPEDKWKTDSKMEQVYLLSPETEMLFILRWQ